MTSRRCLAATSNDRLRGCRWRRVFIFVANDDRMLVLSAHVAREVAGLSERGGAYRTAVGTMSGVHSSVTVQRSPVGKRWRTYRTDERTNGRNRFAHLPVGPISLRPRATPTSMLLLMTLTCGWNGVIRRWYIIHDVISEQRRRPRVLQFDTCQETCNRFYKIIDLHIRYTFPTLGEKISDVKKCQIKS